MNKWSEADLRMQYKSAVTNGWLAFFAAAAAAHGFPVELLLALASRETNMRSIKGDMDKDGVYHGFGIMQVDNRTDPAFCASWTPEQVEGSITRGAQILAGNRARLAAKGIADPRAVAAAYNTGAGNVAKSLAAGENCDHTTTGKDYGTDVLARMAVFEAINAPEVTT
ncbi:MAG TPA: transglycosylase SLT domain-containing protein [Bryobacteraceae bacterium]|nr:transglycosylase SLT domain-containing protein [Bryobacteraceae bacterium]